MTADGRRTVIVRLDPDLHRQLKVLSALSDQSIQTMLETAIEQLVEDAAVRNGGYAGPR